MPSKKTRLEPVRNFWNTEACGSHFVTDFRNEHEFYKKYREFRYQTEWHIPLLVPFSEARGKSVLEIGCGNGADGVMFANNGAYYTGVDITQAAITATKKHFAALGLRGRFLVENAEELSFEDASFDIVYSHGVLHHSPTPANAIREVFRVLKPGGRAIIMLYHKHSFNYYIRILGYMRARVLIKIFSRIFHWTSDKKLTSNKIQFNPANRISNKIWESHYQNFLREGWKYLKAGSFVHHCIDGPECPYAYVFSKADVEHLFSMFKKIQMSVAHFPLGKYRKNSILRGAEKFLAPKIGFYLFIFATK